MHAVRLGTGLLLRSELELTCPILFEQLTELDITATPEMVD
jgi:hypothetical protein